MQVHTRTIQGLPWSPCTTCPRRAENGGDGTEGVCPSRRAPQRCSQVERDPERYGPLIRAEAPEDRPGRVRTDGAVYVPPASPGTPTSPVVPAPEPPLPSVGRMALSLATTAVGVAVGVVTGKGVKLDIEAQEARWRVCRTCDDHFRPSDLRCGAMSGCGCWLVKAIPLVAKTCPMGRWPVNKTTTPETSPGQPTNP